MGVESSAILARWMFEPETRPCNLSDLVIITAQIGDEMRDTGEHMDTHILPLMRENNIRFVQVARSGPRESDGITILEDSNHPTRTFLEGDYKLSDELRSSGVLPAFGGVHRCSLKHKAQVIESWLTSNHFDNNLRHAFGYNADETKRAAKCVDATAKRVAFGFNSEEISRAERAAIYDTPARESFFPLIEWNWTRQDCLDYLFEKFGVKHWPKSACVQCPFNALKAEAIERHRQHPDQVADAMMLEFSSLAMNPRGQLYAKASLIQITLERGDENAAKEFQQRLEASQWSLYRIRRIYQAGKKNGVKTSEKKGTASRAVENLLSFTSRAEAEAQLDILATDLGGEMETAPSGIRYLYQERRGTSFPTREHYYTVAPACVKTKARYGIEWFDSLWNAPQGSLCFEAA
jgi:hypothetical protein